MLTRAEEFGWTQYYNLEQIYEWLDWLLVANESVLTNIDIGLSYENRMIRAVRLSQKAVGELA